MRAKGPVGSVDQTPVVHTWTTGDLTPPVVTILTAPTLAPTGGTTDSTTATFTFSSDDPDAQYLCTLTGAPDPVPPSHQQRFCSSPVTYDGLTPGLPYTFEVEPTKPHLLVSAEPAVWEWTITDTTAPDTTIVSGPARGVLPDAPALFTFSSNEPHATFECSLDGADFDGALRRSTARPTSAASRPARTRCSCARSTSPTRRTSTRRRRPTRGP